MSRQSQPGLYKGRGHAICSQTALEKPMAASPRATLRWRLQGWLLLPGGRTAAGTAARFTAGDESIEYMDDQRRDLRPHLQRRSRHSPATYARPCTFERMNGVFQQIKD